MAERPPRILVVDDIDDNVFTLQRRLKQFTKAEIASAQNGRLALEALRAAPFDLVLLDVQMPEMDGTAVLAEMKADMALRDVPVIMVSALDDLETVLRCIKLGAEDYVQKPFNAELLRARVEAALERKRLRDQEAKFLAQLQAEKARVNDLLHSVLPKSVVSELKASGRLAPRRHDEVAVVFCDIVGFTEYCDGNAPEAVLERLEALVAAFEAVVDRHGLEKIKTIGDAFMATAGLLRYVENPVLAAAECGLAMAEAAKAHGAGWQVRVGIHMGPIVAGILGKRSFVFDLWGDTVNVAARVAAEAEPGTVVVTGALWPFLGASCQGRSLGQVDLKGKGPTEIVCLVGRKAPVA
ncbi:MAG: adenylate/guanylate cyclase domain-containing protein [Alphaproteobacteria bacterium]